MSTAFWRIGGALVLWTAFVVAVLLFFPWPFPSVPCARLVGTPETRAACQPLIDQANQQIFLFRQLPILAMTAAGYVAILLLELRRRRAHRPRGT